MFSLLKSIHVVADVSFQHMFVHLLLQYHPCKCKILVYFSSSVAVCCCLAVMAGIRFIIFPWCCTDSFSEHPTLGSICIVGDVSHYTVMPAEWLVYTSWRLLIDPNVGCSLKESVQHQGKIMKRIPAITAKQQHTATDEEKYTRILHLQGWYCNSKWTNICWNETSATTWILFNNENIGNQQWPWLHETAFCAGVWQNIIISGS
jgi:hypothetical protein